MGQSDALVLFVLAQLSSGKQIILLSSDTTLTGEQVIEAYGWRFKIKVSFRTLVHLLGGFDYRFWLKSMTKISRCPKHLVLADYGPAFHAQVATKVEAFVRAASPKEKRFVNLNAIALGLLQVLALELPNSVWTHFPRWFRTLPKHGLPSEQIVRMALQHLQPMVLSKSTPSLLLPKLLAAKIKLPDTTPEPPFAA